MERFIELLDRLHLSFMTHRRTPCLPVGQPLLLCELFLQRTHDVGEIMRLLGLAPLSTPCSSSPFAWLLAVVAARAGPLQFVLMPLSYSSLVLDYGFCIADDWPRRHGPRLLIMMPARASIAPLLSILPVQSLEDVCRCADSQASKCHILAIPRIQATEQIR
jgi:hypothetical protein